MMLKTLILQKRIYKFEGFMYAFYSSLYICLLFMILFTEMLSTTQITCLTRQNKV